MFTTSELQQLKNIVLADPIASANLLAGNDGELMSWFNSLSTHVVWKTYVTKEEVLNAPSFNWTRVDNLTIGKARIWDMMFSNPGASINPAKDNIRAGIEAAWVGTAADLAVRESVFSVCKRYATLAEAVFAVGAGTTASPSIMGWEGQISITDVVYLWTM